MDLPAFMVALLLSVLQPAPTVSDTHRYAYQHFGSLEYQEPDVNGAQWSDDEWCRYIDWTLPPNTAALYQSLYELRSGRVLPKGRR